MMDRNFKKFLSLGTKIDPTLQHLSTILLSKDEKNADHELCFVSTPRVGSTWITREIQSFGYGYNLEFFNPNIASAINSVMKCSSFDEYERMIRLRFHQGGVFMNRVHGYQLKLCKGLRHSPIINGKVYKIYRIDKVRQAYSCVKAKKTSQWVSGNSHINCKISKDEVATEMNNIKSQQKEIEGIECESTISYEEMVRVGVTIFAKSIINDLGLDFTQRLEDNPLCKQSNYFDEMAIKRIKNELSPL